MFISRRINANTSAVELWECEWTISTGGAYKKSFMRFIKNESFDDVDVHQYMEETNVILWSPGRTIGNIALNSESVLGSFSESSGENAIVPCDLIKAGKFRNGAPRWYCKTHQTHWGIKADYAASIQSGEMQCGNNSREMSYVVNPPVFKLDSFQEIGVWCSLPPALSSKAIEPRAPKIHIHVRAARGDAKKIQDRDYPAVSLEYNQSLGLFASGDITKIHITPPAAYEFVRSIEEEIAVSCINCKKCGYPHLDLGDFAEKPHRKHFCGSCGSDSIWSKSPIVSTPLKPIHDQFSKSNSYVCVDRSIDIDQYKGCEFEIWSSTPAVLWTADRPQEKGIHVHISKDGKRIVDNTFGSVILGGKQLVRGDLWKAMKTNIIL